MWKSKAGRPDRPPQPLFEALEGRVFLSAAGGRLDAEVPWARIRIGAVNGGTPTPTPSPTPTRSPTPTPTPATGGTPLGGNLNAETDRVQDHPFTDLVKTTRGFYNLAGRTASNGKTDFAATDADGWATEDFSASLADNAEYGVPIAAGVYAMSFTGPPGVTVSARPNAPAGAATINDAPLPAVVKTGYDAATGVHSYQITVPAGAYTLALDFRNTGGQVRALKVLQPGYSLASYPTFTNEYLNLLRGLGPNVLRFMDWAHVNNNPVANWADRAKPTDATMGKVSAPGELQPLKGIAWEYIVQLANTLNTNVWVNVPAHATDDYVRQLATLLKTTLDPALTIYLEYSNEVWNTGFEQAGYNRGLAGAEVVAGAKSGKASNLNYDRLAVDTSKADGGANASTWADRGYARRLVEIGNIFKGVWTAAGAADPINSRVRPVLCSQLANLSRFDNMLKYVNTVFGPPKNFFYGIGVAPYVNLGSQTSKDGLTKDQVLSALSGSADSYANGASLSSAKAKASQWGLKLEAYEGGIDTFGPTSIAAKRAAVLDPRIADIMTRYLDAWYAKGGDQLNWVTLGARSYNSPYGSWSITENIGDLASPKAEAFKGVRAAG